MKFIEKLKRYKRKYISKEEATVMACLQSKTTHKTHYVSSVDDVYYVITAKQLDNTVSSHCHETFREHLIAKYTNGLKFPFHEELECIEKK